VKHPLAPRADLSPHAGRTPGEVKRLPAAN
jgi:hypothetical protein